MMVILVQELFQDWICRMTEQQHDNLTAFDFKKLLEEFRCTGIISFHLTHYESKLLKKIITNFMNMDESKKKKSKLLVNYHCLNGIIKTIFYRMISIRVMNVFDFYIRTTRVTELIRKTVIDSKTVKIEFFYRCHPKKPT